MKNILITFAFIFSIPIYAQYPVLSLEDQDPYDTIEGAYYKDLANVLTTFEGTWLYSDGNTSLKIVLVKKTMFFEGKFYEDLMVGEYQYIENGIEKINTLSNLNQNLGYSHKISGNDIHRSCYFMSNGDCTEGEARLVLGFIDANPEKSHFATMVIKKRRINGQHALKVYIVFNYSGYDDPPPSPTLPWQQEYVMFKQ